MSDSVSDIAPLLEKLRAGEQDALARLFDTYRPQLRRMVELRLDPRLGARVAPSDVLQQAYVDSLSRYEHFFKREGASFYVWLRLVVNQSLVDVHRRHLAAKMRDAGHEAAAPWTAATSVSLARHLVAQMESPSQIVRKEETLGQVQAALETLDPLDREILTLRHFEELGNNEVAELLGLAKAAASNRYVRALGRLREALAKVPGFFDDDERTYESDE
jgi:RNA polymerase sigma-70 factor, ECF subfamily